MPVIDMAPMNTNHDDDDDYEALVERQVKADWEYGTLRNYSYIPLGSTVVVQ